MQTWKWLNNPSAPYNWRFLRNVLIKAAVLFVVLNVLFAVLTPLPTLGRLSAYNHVFRGRERLPYGENPDKAYNLSLFQIDAMFASHSVAAPRQDDEYRVLLIGDSAVWGVLLEPEDTLAAQINRMNLQTADGRQVRAYNLGYPTMSLTKDLVLLDYAMQYEPDLVVWLFTLESFDQATQLDSAILQHNPDRVRPLITRYDLRQRADDSRFVETAFWQETIVGRRRDLADLLRLQFYGVLWSVTGIDQEYPDYTPRMVDLPPDETWHGYQPPALDEDVLAWDVLRAGVERAGQTPVLLVNEPMFISQGQNSDLRYNFFYPRWAYDDYRQQLGAQAALFGWTVLDLWDALPDADCYTDSAVHLTPACSARLADLVSGHILQTATGELEG